MSESNSVECKNAKINTLSDFKCFVYKTKFYSSYLAAVFSLVFDLFWYLFEFGIHFNEKHSHYL